MTTLPPQLLDAIWNALKVSANRPSRTDGARPLEARIHAAGWARMYEIEDLLTIQDSSLMFVNVQALPAALGFSAQSIYPGHEPSHATSWDSTRSLFTTWLSC